MAPPVLLFLSSLYIIDASYNVCAPWVQMSGSRRERSRTSHLISLSATHMHVRHADIPGIRIMPDTTITSFRLSIISIIPTVHPSFR
jgi:hypothetical protein